MYNSIIVFIIVLMVWVVYQPGPEPPYSLGAMLAANVALLAGFLALARLRFTRLALRIRDGAAAPGAAFSREQGRLHILALGLYIVNVHLIGLKDLLTHLPALGRFSSMSGLLGLAWFGLYLSILWAESYPLYSTVYSVRLSKRQYVLSQLRFNLPIVIPFFVLTFFIDLAGLFPRAPVKAWLDSPIGELVFVMALMALLMTLLPMLIKPIWGLKPLEDGEDRRVIEDFCRRQQLKYREIVVWPLYEGQSLFAGVMGMLRPWRYIMVSPGLLRMLDRGEVEAVLGHEIGHVKKHHLVWYMFFVLLYILLAYAVYFAGMMLAFRSPWGADLLVMMQEGPTTGLSLALNLPTVAAVILYFRFVFGYFIRHFEREADLYAYQLTGSIDGLVGSLEKIARASGMSRSRPSWHHFSVAERVDFLVEADRDPGAARRHATRLRRHLAGFALAAAVVLVGGAWWITGSGFEKSVQQNLYASILEREVQSDPDRPELFFALGDVYFQMGRVDKARSAWERSLMLKPDQPVVLNNLAWLLITGENPTPEEKSRALEMARKAVRISPEAFILDTLAEAWFVNGRPEKALETIERALARSGPGDEQWEYYEKQKRRFEQAL